MTIKTPLCSLFDIVHPVLLAPMGGIAGGSLAAAVSGAGGLGVIGGGYGDRDWLERQFEAAGNARVGVGFITWSLARNPVLLDIVLERRPAAIFLSFGDPRPYVEKVKASGAKLLIQVQTMAEATDAKNLGADVIIAQGTEAGGHGKADRAIFPLVPSVVDAVGPTPVLAAGGVSDGRQIAAALLLGAAGVLVGTRLYASHEALGHPEAKARIVRSGGDDTLRTHVFDIVRALDWPEIYTGRALTNELSHRWHGSEEELSAKLDSEKDRYAAAAAAGDFETAVVFAGEGLDLIHDVPRASKIVERLVSEAEVQLKRASTFLDESN